MATKSTRQRNNRFDVEWHYALDCYRALKRRDAPPDVPMYTIWEMEEDGSNARISGHKMITPQRVTYGSVTLFGGEA